MAGAAPFVILDLALRTGAGVLLLLLATLLLRDHGRVWAARLGALFALGAAAFALATWPPFVDQPAAWRGPILALSTGDNVVFWLFALAMFDDDFRPRPWQAGLWAAVVAVAMTCALVLRPTHSPLAGPVDSLLALSAIAFASLAVLQTWASWSADLVEPRRRLRVVIVAASAGYIAVAALSSQLGGLAPAAVSLGQALGLAVISAGVAWSFLGVAGGGSLFALPETRPATPTVPADLDLADRALLAALERAMTVDRLYRQEGLTIGQLAHRHGAPEYRLRRLINQGLGHRNFNRFLNGYRIADTCAGLADPAQAETSILTLALDAGFNSLGPFNRAFKAETGLTPTAWRQQALAEIAKPSPSSRSAGRIPKSA